jgi:hypothetical protein
VNQERDGGHVQLFRETAAELADAPVVLLGRLFFIQGGPAAFGGDDAKPRDPLPVQGP